MSLFGIKEKEQIKKLSKEANFYKKRTNYLERLCEEKDAHFKDLMSDALRHGSSKAAKHMVDRRNYLNGK